MKEEKFRKYFKIFWDLLRGNANYRFAALLVRSGVTLVLGPPVVIILATRLLDLGLGEKQSLINDFLAVGAFFVGIALTIGGVLVFRKGGAATSYPDVFSMTIADGETFESTFDLIAAREKKAPIIEGFTEDERRRRVSPHEFEGPDAVAVLKIIGSQVEHPSSFPKYEVIESAADIRLRRIL